VRHPETFSCDMCGKQKASVNHWFKAWVYRDTDGQLVQLEIEPWDSKNQSDNECAHLCGAEHLLIWISQQLGEPQQQTAASS
jgi:hypothetical protein